MENKKISFSDQSIIVNNLLCLDEVFFLSKQITRAHIKFSIPEISICLRYFALCLGSKIYMFSYTHKISSSLSLSAAVALLIIHR